MDLKELFMIYDSDRDGVLTFTQLKNAMGILGKQIKGFKNLFFKFYIAIFYHLFLDEELLVLTRQFSVDSRNLSIEFNEFLKMTAFHKNNLPVRNSGELKEAFRFALIIEY